MVSVWIFFFQAEDGIRDLVRSRGLGDVYKRQGQGRKEPGLPSFLLCRLFDRGERDADAVVDVFGLSLIHI